MPLRLFVLLITSVFLTACAPREVFVSPNAKLGDATVQRIYLATNRILTPGGAGTTTRGDALSFAQYDVSIPPVHKLGQIEFDARNPDPATSFTVASARRIANRTLFGDIVRSNARRVRSSEPVDSAMVYVHGFNTSLETAVYRHAQIAEDYGFIGPQVTFSWPSAQATAAYVRDKDSVLIARDHLEELLIELTRSGQNVFLFGHSMGTQLVAETLRQLSITGRKDVLRRISGVALISPDIDVDLFESQFERIDPLPDPFFLMISNKDYALFFSSILTAQPERLGSAQDLDRLGRLDVIVLDLSNLPNARNHFLAATSPEVIRLVRDVRARDFDAANFHRGVIDVASVASTRQE